jgi:hypothetical protein
MAHSAMLVKLCLTLFEFVVISPAANNHLILVSCLLSTTRHHSLSFSGFKFSTNLVFGTLQMAIKIQSSSRLFPDFSFTHFTHKTSQNISFISSEGRICKFFAFFISFIQETSALKLSFL